MEKLKTSHTSGYVVLNLGFTVTRTSYHLAHVWRMATFLAYGDISSAWQYTALNSCA
jgi:hypothetical protein